MRVRSILALSVAALTLTVAGCSASGGDAEATADATTVASTDLCGSVASPGDATAAITVGGTFGVDATAEFTAPLTVDEYESQTVVEGTGTVPADGDYVRYAFTAYDAETGELLGTAGYNANEVSPSAITAGSALGTLIGCAPEGSRIVATEPAGTSTVSVVYVLDVLEVIPTAEYCQPVAASGDFPTVSFDADGVPAVTIPATDAPTVTTLEVLTEGDGDVVEAGDTVALHYQGVKWSDGTVFDSSWTADEPVEFATPSVVPGFGNALVGQHVGSTVVVSMPPECAYLSSTGNALQYETLVFTIQIVGIVEN